MPQTTKTARIFFVIFILAFIAIGAIFLIAGGISQGQANSSRQSSNPDVNFIKERTHTATGFLVAGGVIMGLVTIGLCSAFFFLSCKRHEAIVVEIPMGVPVAGIEPSSVPAGQVVENVVLVVES